jgi:hypothetical protein
MNICICLLAAAPLVAHAEELRRDDGYRGIWYYNQPSNDRFAYKYAGGFATYPQQQSPIAVHVEKVQKTFFCYGGTIEGRRELLHMVSYFDHRTKTVPRPAVLLNKETDDAHDNPVMAVDDAGHIWIFSNSHGTSRPSFIYKSDKPYDISGFTRAAVTNFSYGHPWWVPGKGFLFLHTLYRNGGRSLFWNTSLDGQTWTEPQLLSRIDLGHYQITAHSRDGQRTATVFNMHPSPVGLNARTNLYYLETGDMGATWKTADGRTVQPPLRDASNAALVHDYKAEGLLVYLKSVEFDRDGRPVILYLTSKGFESGPAHGLRQWKTARWTGTRWDIRDFTTSDHNYDFGSIGIEPDGTWRIVAATAAGPQAWTTGGDIVMWISRDQGASWKQVKQLTRSATVNHTYPRRPVNAHPDFHALWADGDTLKPSESRLYFTDRAGSKVWVLPSRMSGAAQRPAVAFE